MGSGVVGREDRRSPWFAFVLTAVGFSAGILLFNLLTAPASQAAPVTEPVWRQWVYDRMVEHRNAVENGNTAVITTRYKDSAGDSLRVTVRYNPGNGALHADALWVNSQYGYTVICSQRDVCWYKNSSAAGRWVDIPAGRVIMQRLATHPDDLTSRLITKSDTTATKGVRRGLGSTSRYPTDSTYEVLTVRGGSISYRYLSKRMGSKTRVDGWSDTTWKSTVGPPQANFVVTPPDPSEVVPSPWGSRVLIFEHF